MGASSWTGFLVETTTGRVGAQIPLLEGGTWSDPVNAAQSAEIRVPASWLLSFDRRQWWRWAPRAGSVLLCHDDEPVILGPVLKPPSGDREVSTLFVGGLWDLLDGRVVTDGDFGPGDHDRLRTSTVSLQGMSLGNIAWELVKQCQDRPLGWLPISHGSPMEKVDRQRTYKGWNLANNPVGKRLTEITEVIGGPDIGFRPRWVDRGQRRVEWVMVHGTQGYPPIAQDRVPTVDLTAARSRAAAVAATGSVDPVSRVYATGAGQDEGTLIRIEQKPVSLADHMPATEIVVSNTEIDQPERLVEFARSELASRGVQLSQVTVDVMANDPAMPLSSWWPGDAMRVVWPEGWPQLEAGTYEMRVLKRSGQVGSERVQVEFQEDVMSAW